MKKILLIAAIIMAACQANAGNVDLKSAQSKATAFLRTNATSGRLMASAPIIKGTKAVKNSSNASQTAYYIVNTDRGYVIVAGDDRAREILAYGDGQIENINDLPEAMQLFLNKYQKQMEYLQANPGIKVKTRMATRGISVAPLLTTAWSQGKPYNMKTPKKGYGNDPYCKVGCSAVALAQVMNFWKYPASSPALPGYTTETHEYVMPALPEYTFDYDNLLDTYRTNTDQYSDAVIDAIGYLMLYTGYAMNMDYATDRSGAEYDEIEQAIRTFGFDPGYSIEMKLDYDDGTVNYTDEEWAQLIQSELIAGRPLVYCSFDMQSDSTAIAGHAFNVDGYDADNDMYHVNFGMSADKNTYYALDAFTLDNGMTVYDFYPLLFAGLQPRGLSTDPRIYAEPSTLSMEAYAGETATATFTVSGANLTGDITVAMADTNGVFTADVTTVALDELGKTVTVTYAPQAVGTHNATMTLTSEGAEPVTVTLKGTATAAPLVVYDPVMQPADSSAINLTSFRADWTDKTAAENVVSYTLEVNEKPGAGGLLADVDWSTASGNAQDYLPEGWTVGPYSIFFDEHGIAITSDSYIRTNAMDFTGINKVTVVFTAKNYYGWTDSGLRVKTSVDSKDFTFTGDYAEYTAVLNCADNDYVEFFATTYNPTIQTIKIYAGEVTAPQFRAVNETGDAAHRLITGITDKFYTVENLNAEGTYLYKVKALYADGKESAWSNVQTVTLFEQATSHKLGDVDHDGEVAIKDVSALIDYLLSGDDSNICTTCADVNGKDGVDIGDVSALIDMLLNAN